MALKGIIWDFDGTMSPTGTRQYLWFQQWAKDNGKTLVHEGNTLDTFGKFMGFYNSVIKANGPQGVYDALNLPCDMNDKAHPVWVGYEKFKKENPVQLYPGIADAVLLFQREGLRQSINTTNKIASIEKELKQAGIISVFHSMITEETLTDYHGAGNQEAIKKPSKISLSLALEEIGLYGNEVAHVGDTVNDLAASKRVMRFNPRRFEDIYAVGMTYGFETRDILEKGVETKEVKLHFDALADNAKDLVEIVKRLL
ncbi:MAG: HAD hydrolase-like protein [Candidatus Nanoarchaeia archaeon]